MPVVMDMSANAGPGLNDDKTKMIDPCIHSETSKVADSKRTKTGIADVIFPEPLNNKNNKPLHTWCTGGILVPQLDTAALVGSRQRTKWPALDMKQKLVTLNADGLIMKPVSTGKLRTRSVGRLLKRSQMGGNSVPHGSFCDENPIISRPLTTVSRVSDGSTSIEHQTTREQQWASPIDKQRILPAAPDIHYKNTYGTIKCPPKVMSCSDIQLPIRGVRLLNSRKSNNIDNICKKSHSAPIKIVEGVNKKQLVSELENLREFQYRDLEKENTQPVSPRNPTLLYKKVKTSIDLVYSLDSKTPKRPLSLEAHNPLTNYAYRRDKPKRGRGMSMEEYIQMRPDVSRSHTADSRLRIFDKEYSSADTYLKYVDQMKSERAKSTTAITKGRIRHGVVLPMSLQHSVIDLPPMTPKTQALVSSLSTESRGPLTAGLMPHVGPSVISLSFPCRGASGDKRDTFSARQNDVIKAVGETNSVENNHSSITNLERSISVGTRDDLLDEQISSNDIESQPENTESEALNSSAYREEMGVDASTQSLPSRRETLMVDLRAVVEDTGDETASEAD